MGPAPSAGSGQGQASRLFLELVLACETLLMAWEFFRRGPWLPRSLFVVLCYFLSTIPHPPTYS